MKQRFTESLEPDNYPSLADEPLTQSELDVKAHWERFLPRMVKELSQQPGGVDLAVRKAAWLTEYHVALAQAQDRHLSTMQAEAMFRNQWCYLPPETHTSPATKHRTTTSR